MKRQYNSSNIAVHFLKFAMYYWVVVSRKEFIPQWVRYL